MKQKTLCIFVLIVAHLLNSCSPTPTQSPNEGNGANEEPTQPVISQPSEANQAIINLSVNDLNSTPPQDILDEIGYFGGMGGGDDCTMHDYQTPTIVLGRGTDNPQPMSEMVIYACGLPKISENVHITVKLPDNTLKDDWKSSEQTPGQNYGEVAFSYEADLDDPTGMYHFLFEGNGWSLETMIDISSPTLFLDGSKLIFLNFQPNENIRLFIYDPATEDQLTGKIKLIGWQEVQANANGELIINVDYSEGAYVAVGNLSGEVYFNEWQGLGSIVKTQESSDLVVTSTETVPEVSLGEWMIIVGAGFSSYESAWDWLEQYKQFGYPVQVFYRETYIRTAVVGFSSLSDAENTLPSVQTLNPQAYLRSVSEWCSLWTAYPDHIECR